MTVYRLVRARVGDPSHEVVALYGSMLEAQAGAEDYMRARRAGGEQWGAPRPGETYWVHGCDVLWVDDGE